MPTIVQYRKPKSENSKKILLRLPETLAEWIQEEANKRSMSLNAWMVEELSNIQRETKMENEMKSAETFHVRKIDGEWYILNSPDGQYPSGSYFKESTGCKTKSELEDYLQIRRGIVEVKLISI